MDELKFKRDKLLAAVRENRGKHQVEYVEAMKGFRESVVENLKKKIEFLQGELVLAEKGEDIKTSLSLTRPQQYLKDYDRVIKMLEMSHEDEVLLDHQEFTQYVMDDWKWK